MTIIERKRAKLVKHIRQLPGVVAAAIRVRGEVVTVLDDTHEKRMMAVKSRVPGSVVWMRKDKRG